MPLLGKAMFPLRQRHNSVILSLYEILLEGYFGWFVRFSHFPNVGLCKLSSTQHEYMSYSMYDLLTYGVTLQGLLETINIHNEVQLAGMHIFSK